MMSDMSCSRWLAALSVAMLAVPGCIYYPVDYWDPPYPPPWPLYRRVPPPDHLHGWDRRFDLDDPPAPPRKRRGGDQELEPVAPPAPPPAPKDLPATEPTAKAPAAKSEPPPGEVPTAERVGGRAGRVKSPYPPYRELDVTGLPSGSLAKDPVSGKLFRVP